MGVQYCSLGQFHKKYQKKGNLAILLSQLIHRSLQVLSFDNIEGVPNSLKDKDICQKKPIFTKDKDILSIILRIKDISLHLEDLGINKKIWTRSHQYNSNTCEIPCYRNLVKIYLG